MVEGERFLRTRQLAELLGVAVQTIQHWRMSGYGPPFARMGNSVWASPVYRLSDVEAWLANRFKSTKEESRRSATTSTTRER